MGAAGWDLAIPCCPFPNPGPNVYLGEGTPASLLSGGTVRWMLDSLMALTKPPEMLYSSRSVLACFWTQAAMA